MFASSGYFLGAYCPFYQYGLCHRPCCHFKHAKKPVPEARPASARVPSPTITQSKASKKAGESTHVQGAFKEEDEMMKILKNAPSTNLMEKVKKRQEEEKLKAKKNVERQKTMTPPPPSTSLIETFYKKVDDTDEPVLGTFTSHTSLNEISPPNNKTEKKRRVCECDDPDCSGFITESEDEENEFGENGNEKEEARNIFDSFGVNSHDDFQLNGDLGGEKQSCFGKNNQRPKSSDTDLFDTADSHEDNNSAPVRKKKKKKKKLENDEEGEDTLPEKPTNKKRRNDDKAQESTNGNTSIKKKKKKKKSLDEKYEMVFLEEGEQPEAMNSEDEDMVENTKQSEHKVTLKPNDYISVDSVAKTGQGSVKKRIAHTPSNDVVRAKVKPVGKPAANKSKKLSFISPGLAAPIRANQTSAPSSTIKQVQRPERISSKSAAPVVEATASMGYCTENGVYVGKRRIAHASSNNNVSKVNVAGASRVQASGSSSVAKTSAVSSTGKVQRPKLVMEVGGKVPHLLRQRYLDKIIDELVAKCESEKEAIEKGFEEEKIACQRSSRKQIYLNLCANIIKKIRAMPNYNRVDENAPSLNPLIAGQPTVQGVNRLKESGIKGYKKVSSQNSLGRTSVKPVSSGLVNATRPALNNGNVATNKVPARRLSEPLDLNEETFYDYLEKFLLNDGQLWENKYPRWNSQDSSMVEVKDFVPAINPLRRTCCRCGKEYFMNKKGKYITREECKYHWGKLRKKREARTWISCYSCCQGDDSADPCSFSRLHVCNWVGQLTDYVSTESWNNEETKRKVFAIDCEMCYTTQGLELTRVTVVDFYLAQIIDLFVKPDNPIVDYNTKFSGVTKENLKNVDYSLKDIQEIFMNLFDKDTILMGHSLESDLKALKIIHRRVIDTALVFPHRLGLPFKRALKTLMAELLQKIIQDGEGGHDSCEDARSCMELMKYKFNEDAKAANRGSHKHISSSSFYTKAPLMKF
ncbi:RNA exonuclease 1 homolog isoform X2 [Clytia hemisphaerica]|uniref:RNA exonuclease 1 homolog isoform X2 n=1 Tax=Clytia hemisphaerica TaxID=252671 RepID=UPI0034D6ACE2